MNLILKSRWFAAVLQVGLWVLLLLTLRDWRSIPPSFIQVTAPGWATTEPVAVAQISALFAPTAWAQGMVATNSTNPFYTKHFIPPPVPPPAPPTTRQVALTYQGFYQTGGGAKHAFIKVDQSLIVGAAGTNVVANLFVADIAPQSLTLTNPAAHTNRLPFNTTLQVEVPVP